MNAALASRLLLAALLLSLAWLAPVARAADLSGIVADGATLEKVADGFRFTEGPLYDREKNVVLFSDQPTSRLMRFDVKTGKVDVFRDAPITPNGNTFDFEGRLVTCEHRTRRISRTDKDGRIVTLAYEYDSKRLNSPNDLAFRSDGSLYFTDPPYGIRKEQEELGFYGVYRLDPAGNLTLLNKEFVRPNGLAFSPDEKVLYVNDTQQGIIRAFDVQPDGTLANGRLFATLKAEGKRGAPDGMKVDTKGNVYSTGPGGVWVIAPDGTVLGVIETPEVAANCGFGDRDGKTLYITASTGLYRIRLKNAGPVPGKKRR
jgi:Gluconolactonase